MMPRACNWIFICLFINGLLLINGLVAEPTKMCPDDFYWRKRYKKCFPCLNICSTTVMLLSDACKESCPLWRPQQVTTSVTTESSDFLGNDVVNGGKQSILIAAATILILTVLLVALLLYLRYRCKKWKEAPADIELAGMEFTGVQESMPPHEDSCLLKDEDSTSPDLSVSSTNTKIASGSTIPDVQHNDRDETSCKTIYSSVDTNVDSRCNSGGHIGNSSDVTDRTAADVAGITLGQTLHGEGADESIARPESHFVSLWDGAIINVKNVDEENMNELVFKNPVVIKLHSKETTLT